MTCRKCKKEIPEGSVFCCFCGIRQELKPRNGRRGNGQGSAIKRGKTWTAVWSDGTEIIPGTRRTRTIRQWKGGFPSKTAALAYASDPPKIIKEDLPPEAYAPTMEDYYYIWLSSGYKEISKNRQCASRIAWRRLEDLKAYPVSELTIKQLQAVVDDQTSTHYPARDMRTLISHIYKLAVAEGQARTNLSEFIHIPPLDEKEAVPFEPDEVSKFWDACSKGDRMAELIILMIYTGMMPGELRLCKVDMIDTERREIIGCGLKTKKRKETPILYPEAISPVVDDLIATTTSQSGYIIGMNIWRFYDEYHEELAALGVRDLPPYSCRHTTATALAMGNAPISVIQEIMRHAKIATTQRYIHPDMSSAHAAIDTLGPQKEAE